MKAIVTISVELDQPATKKAITEWVEASLGEGYQYVNTRSGDVALVKKIRVRSVDID